MLNLPSKFKTGPKMIAEHETNHPPKMSLTPFSKMLYDNTSFDFTFPIPQAPQNTNGRVVPQQKSSTKSQSQRSQNAIANHQAHNENASIMVQIPANAPKARFITPPQASPARPSSNFAVVIPASKKKDITPSAPQPPVAINPKYSKEPLPQQASQAAAQTAPQTPRQVSIQAVPTPNPPGSNTKLSVVIPDLPPTFRAEEYEILPDSPDTPQYLSRKRKRSEPDGSEEDVSMSLDQREKADMAFRSLRDYLQDIFEAEDQFQSDSIASDTFFVATADGIGLSAATQTKVESLLQKIISVGRFSQVPLDDLLRLQKLCEAALKDAEIVDIKIEETMGGSEVDALLQHISVSELGLKSARTSLRLMSGGREDKQLYSEDMIQAALNVFKNVMENCLIPIVEMRSSGSSSALFKLLSAEKKAITNLLTQCRRLLSLLATLIVKIELSETVINILEFTASRLIFVENAPTEKDSVLGVARFDSLRVVAMDVLSQVFLSNPSQRQGIFDEILTSLEKLPVTKQSARQFKLAEGGSIQLVSALIMRLIQTSASKADESKEKRRSKVLKAINGDEGGEDAHHASNRKLTTTSETRAEQHAVTAIVELKDLVSPLLDTAKSNASYVVAFIVNRAMNSTKSGDAPYRNLLDLFVEDFITCLNSTDWPAAELLLRLFLFKMVHLAEGDKTPAPAKNMALDLLGSMGAAISELISHVRKTASTLENGDADLGKYLSRLAEASLENTASPFDLVSWACGPFRVSLEFLDERCSQDPQLSSAVSFYKAEWASKISATWELTNEEDHDYAQTKREYGRLAYRLQMMITDKRWLSTEYSFDSVNAAHARLAYAITLLHSKFCESFGRVLTILLGSMASEQATVRSKSLKSVNQVLETDPTILDREPAVKHLLLRCSNDPSVLVRDSALGLIGKCINLRPALEEEMIPSILQRVNDSGIGVRKRAMKLSKDIYLRNTNGDIRSSIADSLLHRVTDLDEGVQELARQTIEEVWMSPFYQQTSTENSSAQFKLSMADHVALMIKTVQRGSGVATVLDKVLQGMLSNESKLAAANFRVCKALVAAMFETIIDNSASDGNNAPTARNALQVLTIFARANAKLFAPEQIQLLQPYVANVGGGDDLAIYRSVVIIFRHVLPHLSKVHNNFLASVRKELIPAVSRMSRTILDDIVACLWIISEVLDDFQHLTRLVLSSLGGIHKLRKVDLKDPTKADMIRKLSKLLLITGMCGKHCDLDPQHGSFKDAFPAWKDTSVSKLMSDTFAPFASPDQPLEVRKAAHDAIGMVCQSWPKNFASANISTSFKEVFSEKNSVLEAIIMRSFKDFLLLEEKRSEAGAEALAGVAADPIAQLGVMGGGQGDGIAISIAQQFLQEFIRIALASQDDQALLATEIIASITRQGLVHPKECGPTLIALETSQNVKIADLAFRGHRTLHEKHETILEKEYMKAVHLAYVYQRDVVHDIHGATLNPFAPKLHLLIDVLKISKVKNRKKFFESLCARIDFDPAKMNIEQLPHHLEFSQFLIENMAFFDYASVDELLSSIVAMEKVVAGTGTGIAHAIETEIFLVNLTQSSQADEHGHPQAIEPRVDSARLLQLTASSMMLSCLWEARTFLRRQYNLSTNRRESKGKAAIKDLNKAPIKAQGVNGDKFWEFVSNTMSALESEETMKNQCRSFVELLSVDQDFKIAAEGDDDSGKAKLGTPSEEEDNGTPGPPGSGRGRKRKASNTPGGRKKRARSSSVPRQRGRPKGHGRRASADSNDEDGEIFD
jgi:cohesin loading factor subunit SCC2